jgi:hypothetical protein
MVMAAETTHRSATTCSWSIAATLSTRPARALPPLAGRTAAYRGDQSARSRTLGRCLLHPVPGEPRVTFYVPLAVGVLFSHWHRLQPVHRANLQEFDCDIGAAIRAAVPRGAGDLDRGTGAGGPRDVAIVPIAPWSFAFVCVGC